MSASKARPYPELKEGIERKSVTVWSDGTRMAADIYKPTGLTSEDKLPAIKIKRYGQMNSNLPKWVGYNPLDHAHKIKAPTLIVDAGADELLNYKRNGKAVADILKKTDTPVKHYVIEEMKHYGVYRQYLEQIIGEEVAWFDKHLKGKQ